MSGSGFYETASGRAEELNLDLTLLSLDRSLNMDWGELEALGSEVELKEVAFTQERTELDCMPTNVPSEPLSHEPPPDQLYLDSEGNSEIPIDSLLRSVVYKGKDNTPLPRFPHSGKEPNCMFEVAIQAYSALEERVGEAKIDSNQTIPLSTSFSDPVKLHDKRGVTYKLRGVDVEFGFEVSISRLPLSKVIYRDARLVGGAGEVFGEDVSLACTEFGEDHPPVLMLDLDRNSYPLKTFLPENLDLDANISLTYFRPPLPQKEES